MFSCSLVKIATVRGIFKKHSFTLACQFCFSLNQPIRNNKSDIITRNHAQGWRLALVRI